MTKYSYDLSGNLSEIVDTKGNTTRFEYDKSNNRIKEIDAMGYQTNYTFDGANRLSTIDDAKGQTTRITYNARGQQTEIDYNGEERSSFTYDLIGRVTRAESEYSIDEYSYDLLGRLTRQYNATLDKLITYEYDILGNRTKITDPEQREIKYEYDEKNQITSMTDPEGSITYFYYDAQGREIERVLPNGARIIREYNEEGKLKKITNKNATRIISSFAYDYDESGNRIREQEEDGAETQYTYDALDRLIQVKYPIEKLRSIRDNNLKLPTRYRPIEDEKDQEKGDNKEKNQNQNAKGKKVAINNLTLEANDIGQNHISLGLFAARTGLEELLSLAANDKGNKNNNSPQNNGNSGNNNSGNNNSGNNTPPGQNKEHTPPGQNKNKDNRPQKVLPTEEDIILGYITYQERPDYLLELTSQASYSYDSNGNRTEYTTDTEHYQYSYDANNRLITDGVSDYSYDANGNMIAVQTGEEVVSYSYTVGNKLSKIEYPDGTYVKYGYDAFGRKVYRQEGYWHLPPGQAQKGTTQAPGLQNNNNANLGNSQSAPGQNKDKQNNNNGNGNSAGAQRINPLKMKTEDTRYIYDSFSINTAKEYTSEGSPLIQYYTANNSVVSSKMFGLHGRINPGHEETLNTKGGMMYYHYSGMRNVTELTDRHGGIIEQYRYDAFGGLFTGITAPYNTGTFAGKGYDAKAGMVDMHARWYSPQIGRFTTADPYRGDLHTPHTQNRYAYVGNNPINYWDPLGYWRDGDELLSPQAQAAIWVLTDMYYATNDPAEQDSIRAQANEIRRLDTTRIEYQTTDFIGSSTSNDRYYLPEVKVAFGYNTDWVNIYVVYSEYGIYSNLKNAYTQEVVSKIQIGSITYTDTTVTTGTDFRPFTPKEWYEENKGILDGYGMLPPASSTTTSTKTTSSSTTTNYDAKQIEARLLTAQKANSASVIVGPDTAKHLAYIKDPVKNPLNSTSVGTQGTGKPGPTLMEAAEIADHVYGRKGSVLSGGWEMVRDPYVDGGLRMGVYGRIGADGKMEYVIANAGTEPASLADWKNNLQQPLGKSKDMLNSIDYAKEFVERNPNAHITFVGHSKGGAEAAANAVETNRNAILFNPATVNLQAYGLDSSKYTAEMTAYIVKGDILNNIFHPISKPIDNVVYLPRQSWWNSFYNHSMDAVKEAIKKWEESKK